MRTGRPKQKLELSDLDRTDLEAVVNSRSLPHGLVRRARMVLMSVEGMANHVIAEQLGVSQPTVSHWRRRFREQGISGLHGELRAGRPRSLDDDQVAELINTALQSKPPERSHWSVRRLAEHTAIAPTTVHRYLKTFGLQAHRSKTFKLSNDPFFVEKVRDIVGLYLNPPDNALVLCVDEKSQIQALDRTQPLLPMGLGYVEGVTHDYIRHGTTTLFAALDIANGTVLAQCKKRHRHQEFLSFLRHIDANVPKTLDVHLIIDNYATHKHTKVKAWLARRPRFHVHFTPTYASWINQVERWFGVITQHAIRRGSFSSVTDLKRKIQRYVEHHNQHPQPFVWTATADSILSKIERLCKVINGTSH
jgi:transposase